MAYLPESSVSSRGHGDGGGDGDNGGVHRCGRPSSRSRHLFPRYTAARLQRPYCSGFMMSPSVGLGSPLKTPCRSTSGTMPHLSVGRTSPTSDPITFERTPNGPEPFRRSAMVFAAKKVCGTAADGRGSRGGEAFPSWRFDGFYRVNFEPCWERVRVGTAEFAGHVTEDPIAAPRGGFTLRAAGPSCRAPGTRTGLSGAERPCVATSPPVAGTSLATCSSFAVAAA